MTLAEETRPALVADLERVRGLLDTYLSGGPAAPPEQARAPHGPVDTLADRLGLSPFERDLLVLAAAVELDGGIASLVAEAVGTGDARPTFALAMAALPGAHWDALTPDRPLRRWRLVHLAPGASVATRPLSIDEHVLHTLTGLTDQTSLLGGLADPAPRWEVLTPSQQAVADEVAASVLVLNGPVLVHLEGPDRDAQLTATDRVARRLGLTVLRVRDAALPEADLRDVAATLDREALVARRLLVTGHDRLLTLLESRVVATVGPREEEPRGRTLVARTLDLPRVEEQASLWMTAMSPELGAVPDLERAVRDVAHHYRLSARSIAAIADEWSVAKRQDADTLRRLTRERSRTSLGSLAERIEPRAAWEDLIVPEGQRLLLEHVTRQVRHRSKVYEEWGFGARSNRAHGVTALFAGESGTGKTMAAEVIAGDLGLDLYRIDLSAVVSKYIGETEKNLRRLFDAAEASGAVLLFDEADALFGRRSEVKDSHDRYANLEVAYLLQRMETYRGLAILTTNLRSNVDRAFLRRLRFVVQFPFPDEHLREQIWRRAFPGNTPTELLDPVALARLQVPGGTIHAIAVAAAFAAAADGGVVRPEHVLYAAKVEYAKAERNLTDSETSTLTLGRGAA